MRRTAVWIAALVGSGACGNGSPAEVVSEIQRAVTGTITISGRAAFNGHPYVGGGGLIPGVTVTLAGTRTGVQTTDADGNFAFTGLPPGSYSVRPTFSGVSFLPDVVNFNNQATDVVQRFSATPLPGGWAPARVFGQVDFTLTATNMVVPNRVFHPGGVLVDRMPSPTASRLWVFDGGNNRILGFRNVGTCVGGPRPGTACTEHSGCGSGGSCAGNLNRNADLVLGQPSTTDRSACNADNTKRAPAARNTLCLTPYPLGISPAEGPQGGQMASDAAHNLYLVDVYNNRVLRFDNPFTNDNLPDKVWGQADYTSRECNRAFGAPAADRLCTGDLDNLGASPFFSSGVDVTPDGSTLWVADLANNRVLRIPTAGTSANLVLGQPDLQSTQGCDGTLATLCGPNAVRFDPATNRLYVADGSGANVRVLVFQNPTTNGQLPSSVISPPPGSVFNSVRGITLDPTTPNAIWINDTDNNRLLQYVNGTPTKVLGQANFIETSCFNAFPPADGPLDPTFCGPHGSIGIDRDGTVYVGDLDGHQRVDRFRGPQPPPSGIAHAPDAFLLNQGNIVGNNFGVPNRIGPAGFNGPDYVLLSPVGMVIADRFRLLFWRNYATGGPGGGNADGVLGQADFASEDRFHTTHGDIFTAVALDSTRNLLYAMSKTFIIVWNTQNGLVSTAAPAFEIASPLPLRGGGSIDFRANGIAVDPATNTAWLADTDNHRLLRILNVSQPNRQVDTVLGQANINSTGCNRGAGRDFPARNSFCIPAQVTFDRLGNLYVVDSTWEGGGNQRALEFNRTTLPPIPAPQVFWPPTGGPLPDRVYSKPSFTTLDCDEDRINQPCTPIYLAFEPGTNRMVMTVGAEDNPLENRIFLYNNPVPPGVTTPRSNAHVPLPLDQGGSVSWDASRRLAIMDHNWNRVVLVASPPM